MEIAEYTELQTKQCPFCAEAIQAKAIKCRFCGEFLNTDRSRQAQSEPVPPCEAEEKQDGRILFVGRPSLWGLVGSAIKGMVFVALAVFVLRYPIENLSIFQQVQLPQQTAVEKIIESQYALTGDAANPPENQTESFAWLRLNEQQKVMFGRYRVAGGIGFIALVICILLFKAVNLKAIRYEVSEDRIEWSRGILDRRVDNLDMFRVVDLSLRRSLLDCIFGIGTISLITTDKTDPKFAFRKIKRCRRLYDVIKNASLTADRKTGVVHLE